MRSRKKNNLESSKKQQYILVENKGMSDLYSYIIDTDFYKNDIDKRIKKCYKELKKTYPNLFHYILPINLNFLIPDKYEFDLSTLQIKWRMYKQTANQNILIVEKKNYNDEEANNIYKIAKEILTKIKSKRIKGRSIKGDIDAIKLFAEKAKKSLSEFKKKNDVKNKNPEMPFKFIKNSKKINSGKDSSTNLSINSESSIHNFQILRLFKEIDHYIMKIYDSSHVNFCQTFPKNGNLHNLTSFNYSSQLLNRMNSSLNLFPQNVLRAKIINLIRYEEKKLFNLIIRRCILLIKKIKKELYKCIEDIMVDLSEKEGLVFEKDEENKSDSNSEDYYSFYKKSIFYESMNDSKQKYLILIYFLSDMFSHIKKIVLLLDPFYQIVFSLSRFLHLQLTCETIHKGFFLELILDDNVIKVIDKIQEVICIILHHLSNSCDSLLVLELKNILMKIFEDKFAFNQYWMKLFSPWCSTNIAEFKKSSEENENSYQLRFRYISGLQKPINSTNMIGEIDEIKQYDTISEYDKKTPEIEKFSQKRNSKLYKSLSERTFSSEENEINNENNFENFEVEMFKHKISLNKNPTGQKKVVKFSNEAINKIIIEDLN